MGLIIDHEAVIGEELAEEVRAAWERVLDVREEILRAFVAKYGLQPEDVVIVERRTVGGSEWWVERRGVEKCLHG